jgi:hypothetical protein
MTALMSPSSPHEYRYTNALTDVDHIAVRYVSVGRSIVQYSVQYNSLIEGSWRKITRIDSKHGSPHRHIFRMTGTQYRESFPYSDLNESFTQALELIKRNFASMKANYLLTADRRI